MAAPQRQRSDRRVRPTGEEEGARTRGSRVQRSRVQTGAYREGFVGLIRFGRTGVTGGTNGRGASPVTLLGKGRESAAQGSMRHYERPDGPRAARGPGLRAWV